LDYLKDEVKEGDELYNKKEYGNAFIIYQGVLDRISNSITKDKSGRIISKSTVTSIKKTSLPDSFFQ
jgi:hypothetical protein